MIILSRGISKGNNLVSSVSSEPGDGFEMRVVWVVLLTTTSEETKTDLGLLIGMPSHTT